MQLMQGSTLRGRAAGVVVSVLALCGAPALADTIYVATCGDDAWSGAAPDCLPPDGPKATIQAAIDAALDEDEIAVLPGTYNETIDFIGKAVRLYSTDGPEVTVIDAERRGSVVTCRSGEGAATVLEGLTIRGGFVIGFGGGMYNENSSPTVTNCTFAKNIVRIWVQFPGLGGGMSNMGGSPTVTNCTFSGNTAEWGGGMSNYASSPTVTNCTFSGNTAELVTAGMSNMESSSPTVTNCTFIANTAGYDGGGMSNAFGSSPTVTECTFAYNTTPGSGGGMYNVVSSPTVTNCTFSGNTAYTGGGMVNFRGSVTVTNCTFIENTAGYDGGGMANRDSSVTVTECTFDSNSANFGGGMFCSDDSSPVVTDATFVGNFADGGGGIWGGMPEIGDSYFCDNRPNHIGGAWIDAGGNDLCPLCDDSAGDVLEVPGQYPTIQSAIEAACDGTEVVVSPGTYDEGLLNFGGKAITVRSTNGPTATVIDAQESEYGVLLVNFEGPDSVFDGFTVRNAVGGAGARCRSSSPTVTNCVFSENTGDWDTGGGMFNHDESSPTVTNCTFSGNTAEWGGGMSNYESSPTVTNCTFIANSANFGGGMFCSDDSSPTVTECTFTANVAPNGRAIACNSYQQPSDVALANCILWNGGDEIWNNDGSTIVISYSDVQGGYAGTGNIDADPLCDEDGRPQAGSPCIDAGANNAVPADLLDLDNDGDTIERVPIDLDGNHRFTDDGGTIDTGCGPIVVDMGAFEFPGEPVHPVLIGDIDLDGTVGADDLIEVLGAWGACDPECCLADVDFTWEVDFDDLLIVLDNWS